MCLGTRPGQDLGRLAEGIIPEEFRLRSRSLVEKIIRRHPGKPVVLVTIFPNGQSPQNAREGGAVQVNQLAFDEILRDLVRSLGQPSLHLVEGRDILRDYRGISKDLIHPGDYGHIEMGANLAAMLRGLLETGGL